MHQAGTRAQSKVDPLARPVDYFILQALLARHSTKALHQAGIILPSFQFNYKQSDNAISRDHPPSRAQCLWPFYPHTSSPDCPHTATQHRRLISRSGAREFEDEGSVTILTFAISDLGRQGLFSRLSTWERWSVLGDACYRGSRLGVIVSLVGAFLTPHLIVFVSSLCYLCIVHRECRPFTL